MAFNLKIFSLTLCLIQFKLLVAVDIQGKVLGEKYYIPYSVEKVSWYRAYQLCAKVGMQLASIESETEFKNLRDYLYETCKYYF